MYERGYQHSTAEARQSAFLIVNRYCYCATSYVDTCNQLNDEDRVKKLLKQIELPDGGSFELDKELFQAPEVLFKPELIGKDEVSNICDVLHTVLAAQDRRQRNNLNSLPTSLVPKGLNSGKSIKYDVLLIGSSGLSQLQGLAGRLQAELQERHWEQPKSIRVIQDYNIWSSRLNHSSLYEEFFELNVVPSDSIFDWERHIDRVSGEAYFFNPRTGKSSWDPPSFA